MRTRLFLFLSFFLVCTNTSQAFLSAYQPAPLKKIKSQFLLKSMGCFFSLAELNAKDFPDFPKLVFKAAKNDWQAVVSGKDDFGRSWSVMLDVSRIESGFLVFAADLDNNARQDFLIVSENSGNGWAPKNILTVLMFDVAGQASFAEYAGFFEVLPDGHIKDLVDLDGDHRAELFLMTPENGYWKTHLIRAHEAGWQPIEGSFGGLVLPMFTRFTHKPNHKVVPGPQGQDG